MKKIDKRLVEKTINPIKRIEIIVRHSKDRDIMAFYKDIIATKGDSEIEEILFKFIIRVAPKHILSAKKADRTLTTKPLLKLSEKILKNINNILTQKNTSKSTEFKPIDAYIPPSITSVIFFKKIFRIFSRDTKNFLEYAINKITSSEDLVATLGIALYYERLSKREREIISKYFARTENFQKTLALSSLLYLMMEESAKIIIKTKNPYFSNKYLAGYPAKELPIGTELIVIEKRGAYYYAKKEEDPAGKIYTLHKEEVEIIGKKEAANKKLIEKTKEIIKRLLK